MSERKRPTLDQYFTKIAHTVASRSTCHDKQVGCVLVDCTNHIVSTGYNGPPIGVAHCEMCCKETDGSCPAIHAEANAVMQCTSSAITAYCTLSPCERCQSLLYAAGVRRVVFTTVSAKSPVEIPTGMTWEHRPELAPWPERIRQYHRRLGKPYSGNEQEQMRHYCLALFMEVAELTESFQWKPWREGYSTDTDNFLEELADILVFMDSLLMLQGQSWDALFERLDRKLEEIHSRIDNGYHTKRIDK